MNKKLTFCVLAVALLFVSAVLPSCSSSEKDADAASLLQTLPAETVGVVVVNVPSVAEKMKTSEKDEKLDFDGSYADDLLLAFLDADSGVRQTVLVAGWYKEAMLTGFVDNEADFKKLVEDREGKSWENAPDCQVCGSVVLKGNQFWWHSKSYNATLIEDVINVKPENSLYAKEEVKSILPLEKDIEYVIDFSRLMSMGMAMADVEKMLIYRNIVEMWLGEISWWSGSVNFDNDRIIVDAAAYDSKGEPVKGKFEMSNLNVDLLEFIPKNTKIVVGVGTSSQMWTNVLAALEPMKSLFFSDQENADAVFENIASMLSNIDGGVVLGITPNPKQDMATLLIESQDEESAKSIISGVENFVPFIISDPAFKMENIGKLAVMNYKVAAGEAMGRRDIAHLFNGSKMAMYVDCSDETSEENAISHLEMVCGEEGRMQLFIYIKNDDNTQNSIEFLVGKYLKKQK